MKNNRFVASVLFPGMVFLGIFVMIPILYGLGISLYDYNPANSRNPFLGLANYRRLIRDEVFESGRQYGFLLRGSGERQYCSYAVSSEADFVLPSKGPKTVFRTIFFIPCIAPMVGTAMIWKHGIIGDGKWSRQPGSFSFLEEPQRAGL
ncbi:MAG: hypothetical protein ACLUUO_08615 [Sellimonas intestinalis]